MTPRSATLVATAVLAWVTSAAAGMAGFNYPQPPQEGRADFFTLSENGRARCCLVLPERPKGPEVQAAEMLRTYLQLVTGGTFARCGEKAVPAGLNQVHLGDTKAAMAVPLDISAVRYGDSALPNVNGYLVHTPSPQLLIIRGVTPEATLLGAVGVLRRYAGVRRYWPGEPGGIGDVVPQAATLKFPQVQWRDWPYFVSRTMSGCDERGPRPAAGRAARFYDFWRMNATIPSNESYYRLMKSHEHLQEPELFPLINGQRQVPQMGPGNRDPNGWQPCVSNPRVAEIMRESIRAYFRANPSKFALNLAVNDGYGDCLCEKCRSLDAPGADRINRIGLCDRYVTFDNRVAEAIAAEFPGRILAFLAYGSMSRPPVAARLHPMLMPVLCVGGNTFQMWDDWARTGARHMGVYFYHDDAWFIMPKLDVHQAARRLRYLVASGLARHFYQEFYGIYPLDGMVGYVEQELLWDPRTSEDAILAEYYARFFGRAAAPMKAFYDALEEGYRQWLSQAGQPHPQGCDASSITDSKSIQQFAVLPPAQAEKARSALAAALVAGQGDRLVSARVELVETLFAFAALGTRTYWAGQRLRAAAPADDAATAQVLADAREAVDAGLALADYRFAVMEKPEIQAYENHPATDTFYHDLTRGVVHAEILDAIDGGCGRVSALLRKTRSPAGVEIWWRGQQRAEPRGVLRRLMEVAACDAGGRVPASLVRDPSFEERAAKQPIPAEAGDLDQWRKRGINVWASSGTPVRCELTSAEAHFGKYSLLFRDTQRAGIAEGLPVKEGDCLRMSVWVKHNDRQGLYSIHTDPRAGAVHLPRVTMPIPWKPGQWQQLSVLFVAQPGAQTVAFRVFVQQQSPGAKIWVDDFSIGKYPAESTNSVESQQSTIRRPVR